MNYIPLPLDLDYADAEPVQLDITAIVTRGIRLRRQRTIARVVAVVSVLVVLPAAVTTDITVHLAPRPEAGMAHAAMAPRNGFAGIGGRPEVVVGGPLLSSTKGFDPFLSAPPRVRLAVTTSVTLPSRFGQVRVLAGDQRGGGVWFAALAARASLFHLSQGGALKSWPLPSGPAGRAEAGSAALAMAAAGVAWVGLGSILIRASTKTGQVSSWQIPAPRANSGPDHALRPGQPRRTVSALAAGPGGQVAVAMSDSSGVLVFSPAAGRFRQILLPETADQPQAVGFARDGALGIGFSRPGESHANDVMLVRSSGSTLVEEVTDAFGVTGYGRQDLLVGVSTPDVVSPRGMVGPLIRPAGPIGLPAAAVPPATLPDGSLAVPADNGILTFPAAAPSVAVARARSVLYLMPRENCGTGARGAIFAGSVRVAGPVSRPVSRTARHAQAPVPSAPARRAKARHKAVRCALPAYYLATDPAGDFWIVTGARRHTVDLLKPANARPGR